MWSWSGWGIVLALCFAVVSVALLDWLLMRLQKSSGTDPSLLWWAVTSRGRSDDDDATSGKRLYPKYASGDRNDTKIDDAGT